MAAAIGQPMVIAARANPATMAPVPSTPWANSGTYDVSPSSSTPTTSEVAIAAPTTRCRNTHSGSTGSAARRSTSTKATSTSSDPTSSPMLTGDAQSHRIAALEQGHEQRHRAHEHEHRAEHVDLGPRPLGVAGPRLLLELAPQHPGRERRPAGG